MTKTAKTYGDALYELAEESGKAPAILEELETLEGILRENPAYVKLIGSGSLKKEERCGLLDEAFRGRVDSYLLNFLKILSERGHFGELSGILEEYRARHYEASGILEVKAVSAVPLRDAQRDKLTQKLREKTGKTILLREKVDPSVLGGLRLETAGKSMDGTVAGEIRRLGSILNELSV